jgi:hypothetical protein
MSFIDLFAVLADWHLSPPRFRQTPFDDKLRSRHPMVAINLSMQSILIIFF